MHGKRFGQSKFRRVNPSGGYIRGGISSLGIPGDRASSTLAACNSTLLHDSILAVFKAGHGIFLAPTSDRGAIAITITEGGERRRAYPHDDEGLADTLSEIIDYYTAGWEHE